MRGAVPLSASRSAMAPAQSRAAAGGEEVVAQLGQVAAGITSARGAVAPPMRISRTVVSRTVVS
jgi:hypothetical protein